MTTSIAVRPRLQRTSGVRLVGIAGPDAGLAWRHVLRRGINLLVALLGLVLAAPLMLAIFLLIRLTSAGPVFFVQTRIGMNRRGAARRRDDNGNGRRHRDAGGVPFRMYKFRTMYATSAHEPEVWARPDDPRVTPVGRLLRQLRLDELPQLFNVLKGDMNVVGPRPEQPNIFQRLRREIPGYELRQLVRPGITGWAQVNQCYDRSIEDVRRKLSLDLEYVARRGALADLRIMLRTLPVMLRRQGAW